MAADPCLRRRIAVEKDVKDGRAVFYLGYADEIEPVHVDIGLPHCAIIRVEGTEIPAVVIQSERADHKHYIESADHWQKWTVCIFRSRVTVRARCEILPTDLTKRWSQPLAVEMRAYNFMEQFSMFATLAVASGGSSPSR